MSSAVVTEMRPRVASCRLGALAAALRDEVAALDARVAVVPGVEAAALVSVFSSMAKLASATGASAGEAGQTIATADALGEPALAPTRAAMVGGALTPRQ